VLRTAHFWLLALPMATSPLVVTALIFHQVGIFDEKGLSSSVAASTFFPFAIASALASIGAGFLVDRWSPRPVFVISMSLLAVGLAFTFILDTVALALVYGAILGATGGTSQLVSGASWAHYYGREGLGRIQGSATMVGISAAAIGPLPLAALEQGLDGFGPSIALMLPLPIVSAIAFWMVTRDRGR
jgi:MFS family permease